MSGSLIVALAGGSVGSGCLGLAFGTWLWRVQWDTRLLLILLLAGMLCLGEEVVDLGLAAGAARLGLIVSAIGVPATALLVLARLSVLPPGLLRIAAVCGLDPGQRFRWLILPLAAPAVIGGVLFAGTAGLVDFLLPPTTALAGRMAVLATPALAVLLSATVLLSPRRV